MCGAKGENIPAPNLPVSEDAFQGSLIESVHTCHARIPISSQTVCNEILLVQELGIFGPICDYEEGSTGNRNGGKAFDNEDPVTRWFLQSIA